MRNQTDFGKLIAVIGFVVLIGEGVAHGQIDGAVQYPPLSIGEDAQPPAPAKMVPQPISPRDAQDRNRTAALIALASSVFRPSTRSGTTLPFCRKSF